MSVPQIFESEYRFCLILWEHEPVNSTQLVHLCQEQLGWSKATTYTVIRRLSQRGVVKNENAVVTSLVTKEQVQQSQIDQLVDKTFEGSLPAFVAAFARGRRLSEKEVRQLQQLIAHWSAPAGSIAFNKLSGLRPAAAIITGFYDPGLPAFDMGADLIKQHDPCIYQR